MGQVLHVGQSMRDVLAAHDDIFGRSASSDVLVLGIVGLIDPDDRFIGLVPVVIDLEFVLV